MLVVRLRTGVAAVVVPDRKLIFVDPDLDHAGAVEAICAALPSAHPDAVDHWVELVMPTIRALTEDELAASRRRLRRRSRRARIRVYGRRIVRYGMRATALTAACLLGALGTTVTHSHAPDTAWAAKPVSEIRSVTHIACAAARESQGEVCRDEDGVRMTVTSTREQGSLRLSAEYAAPDGTNHYAVLYVSPTPEDHARRVEVVRRGHMPNLRVGETWLMYGTEGSRVTRWAAAVERHEADKHRSSKKGP